MFVQNTNLENTDKKAAVMGVLNKLYDYVAAQALPIWLRPFNAGIKKVLLTVIVNYLIDFMVQKYKSGFWNLEQNHGETN